MDYKTIFLEIKDKTATIWLNRPEVRNAFNDIMIREISHCFDNIDKDDNIRIIVIRGKGESFCAGADLNWLGNVRSNTYEENYKEGSEISLCFNKIYNCSKPVITIAHGASIGGGNGFLAASDFAFCEDNTVFSLSEVKIGVVPSCISPYVYKRVGESGAAALILSGLRIKGKEAQEFRLVNKSLAAEEIEEHLQNTINTLMSSGPKAITACKQLINNISNTLTFEESIDYTAKMIAELRASDEGQEGMASFLEKRKTNWNKI